MAQASEVLDQAVAELEALRPEEFVAARNNLARTLRQRGERATAARIAGLRRPSMSVWAANQLSRVAAEEIAQVADAGAALETTQRQAMEGDAGAARSLRQLAADVRQSVARLAERGREVLIDAGYQASQSMLQRLATTLHAAVATADGRAALAEGRLTQDLDPPGFGDPIAAMAATAVPEQPPAPAQGPEQEPKPEPSAEARRALVEARAREEAATREAAAAQDAADQAQEASSSARTRAAALRQTAAELRKAADAMVERAEDAERTARQADGEAEESARAAEDATDHAREADSALGQARQARQAAEEAAGPDSPRA